MFLQYFIMESYNIHDIDFEKNYLEGLSFIADT